MPSGSVPLLDVAKTSGTMRAAGVVETLIQESPIIEQMPFMSFQGNALETQVERTLPSPAFRAVNQTYTRSWGTDDTYTWGVTILGGEVFVDNYLVRVAGDVVSAKAKQWAKFAKAMARTFDKNVIDGNGTSNTFKGINTLITEGFGQTVGAAGDATNGGALVLSDLDIAHDLVRGQDQVDAIWLNRTVRRKITSLAKTTSVGYPYVDVGTDNFGRQVMLWNGIPLRIIGDDKDGAAILDFDETRGSSNVTTSLYMVSFGDGEGLTGLLGLGGAFEVVDFGETENAPGHLGRVEAYPGVAIFNPHSVVRLAGITNA